MVAWIFIMIAGGLILVLAAMVAMGIGEVSNEEQDLRALNRLETIMVTQQSSSQTVVQVPIIKKPMDFQCDYLPEESFVQSQIVMGDAPLDLTARLVAGNDMETDELIMFSRKMEVPFDAGNVLILTSPDDLLVIDTQNPSLAMLPGDGGTLNEIRQYLPRNVSPQTLDSISGDLDFFSNVRVVIFGREGSDVFTGFDEDATLIRVMPRQDGVYDSGTLHFYEDEGRRMVGSLDYYGYAMMFGLIYQSDYDKARCLQYKMAQNIARNADLNKKRMELLEQEYRSRQNNACAANYKTDIIKEYIPPQPDDPGWPNGLMQSLGSVPAEDSLSSRLEAQNQKTYRRVRCATIY